MIIEECFGLNMKIASLIESLSKFDPEAVVVVNGYEGGFEEPEDPREIYLCPNDEKDNNGKLPWWEGEYQECFKNEKKGILLSRKYRFNK